MEGTIRKKALSVQELAQYQQAFASIIAELKHIGSENFKKTTPTPTLQDTMNYLKQILGSEDLERLESSFKALDYDALIQICNEGIKALNITNYYK